MGQVVVDISTSLDGFVAGPNPTLEEPLGENGERLHDWALATESWRESHGYEGGEGGVDSDIIREGLASVGAFVMGRKMFSGGSGPWGEDPNARGWWGDEPPFHAPVFVLTHHDRSPEEMDGGTTFFFVTDGIEAAVTAARAAARERDVGVSGGAEVVQQALAAGLVDQLQVHVAPILLGAGTRLFDGELEPRELELTRVVDSPKATHLRYRLPSEPR